MADVLSHEFAEAEFNKFMEMMDLDIDIGSMNEDDKASLSESKNRLISAFKNGSLVMSDGGQLVYVPRRSDATEPITFYEPTGASLMAMDRKKKNADISKAFALLADMTKQNAKVFSEMVVGDLNVCLAVMALFMG